MFSVIAFVIGCHNFGFILMFANDQVLGIQKSNNKLLTKKLLKKSVTNMKIEILWKHFVT